MNAIHSLLTIVLTLFAILAPQMIALHYITKREAEAAKHDIEGLSQPAE